MLVEPFVLYDDDRLRQVLAQALRTDRPAVLLRFELTYPIAVYVVDGGVVSEVRVGVPELVPLGVDHVPAGA